MKREIIHTDQAPDAIGPYSQATRCCQLVFTAMRIPGPVNGVLFTVNGEQTSVPDADGADIDTLDLSSPTIGPGQTQIDITSGGDVVITDVRLPGELDGLGLLKQICDHPALVEKDTDHYDRYRSGKWDLFCELLVESLDSGQKVVIYSQYLDMIEIIESFLQELKVGYVSLTGKSRNRGAIIERFNEEPDCRVYVGSLRAGGTGIDLVENDRMVKVKPDKSNLRSRGYACRKGLKIAHLQHHTQRLTRPLKKTTGGLEPVSWDSALDDIAGGAARLIERLSPSVRPRHAVLLGGPSRSAKKRSRSALRRAISAPEWRRISAPWSSCRWS